MALDPELLKQLGLKRASELEAPDGAPAQLPWNGAAAELDEKPGAAETAPSVPERTDRSILRQHRENRIAAGTLRVPQVRAKRPETEPEGFEPDAPEASEESEGYPSGRRSTSRGTKRGSRGGGSGRSGGSRSGAAGSRSSAKQQAGGNGAGREGTDEPFVPAPAPDWADVGAPPSWATDGALPERATTILEEWDRREAEAAELIAAGVEVVPQEETAAAQVIELSDEEAEQLARAICLRLLTAMPRTRFELEKKLQERDVPVAAAQSVLDRYEELGIIDDAAFATAWVESRSRSKGFARGRLKQELRRKGVDGEDLETALEQIDSDQERERAEELALRKLGSRTLPPASGYGTPDAAERDKILRRVIGFLARKGYPGGMAMSAARAAMERHDAGER